MAQAAMVALTVGATGLQAYSQHRAGQQASKLATVQSDNLRKKAIQEQAVAQRRAAERRSEAEKTASRAVAVNAAAGGGLDVSFLDVLGDIAGKGEYNARTEMFEGDMKARDLNYQAEVVREQGKQARRAANIQAVGTVLSGAASMMGGMKGMGGKTPIAPNAGGASGGAPMPWKNPDMNFGGR